MLLFAMMIFAVTTPPNIIWVLLTIFISIKAMYIFVHSLVDNFYAQSAARSKALFGDKPNIKVDQVCSESGYANYS